MRVGNSSEKYDASVAYCMSCGRFMTTTNARMMITADPVWSSGKNAIAQTIEPSAPHRNTGRRPTRSVSAAVERDHEARDRRADDDRRQQDVAVDLERVLAVGQRERDQHVEGDVLGAAHSDRAQHVLRVLLEDLDGRRLLALVLLLQLGERGRLLDLQADVEADRDEQTGREERHAPAPALERRVAQRRRHDPDDRGRDREAAGEADLRPRAVEAALALGRVLGDHQHGAAPLAAECGTLDQAQGDQQDRGPDADRVVARQRADARSSRRP